MEIINQSFENQAKEFENPDMSFSKQEYLDYTMSAIGGKTADNVLEVAAGTCLCGRTLAPKVHRVTCIDATQAMLDVGITEAQRAGIKNMNFIHGMAEEIPFKEATFDIVMTRLSFHHFQETEKPFSEMSRVLKPGGKLVVIDMEATEESLRDTEDYIERLRDCSHVRNRSRQELLALYRDAGYKMLKEDNTKIPVRLSAWMELTKTSPDMKQEIVKLMERDMAGEFCTGFKPYRQESEIWFEQRWLLLIGLKL